MVHTSLLVNIMYGAWYTLTRVDLECCREAALLLLAFFLFVERAGPYVRSKLRKTRIIYVISYTC